MTLYSSSLYETFYEALQKLLQLILHFFSRFAGSQKLRQFVNMRSPGALPKALVQAQHRIQEIENKLGQKTTVFWFHVASAGELEQAVPIARTLHNNFGVQFFLTYFSPSAEPFVKNFPGLVGSCGMPLDVAQTHLSLLHTLHIQHLFFVRYDLWPGMLRACRQAQVPVSVLAATASSTRGGWAGKVSQSLKKNRYLFVQNLFAIHETDVAAFKKMGLAARIYLAGDSKWSRAKERSEGLKRSGLNPRLRGFAALCMLQKVNLSRKCFVFGSPHAEEQDIALRLLNLDAKCLVVYVPPEIAPEDLRKISAAAKLRGHTAVLLSELLVQLEHSQLESSMGHEAPDLREELASPSQWLNTRVENSLPARLVTDVTFVLVDQMGFLAELYSLADVAIVGGGFDGQIHNTLEPAVHPVATIYGSNCARAPEANALVQAGAALTFATPEELFQFLRNCARLHEFSTPGLAPAQQLQQLAELKLRCLELFKQIPNTSEVVSSALFPGKEPI